MMLSTKAEYGVRVMVELARRSGGEPIPLAEIAADDGLPLAYLEHLVARLRKAGLVKSRRGSRGGYLLARPAAQTTMAGLLDLTAADRSAVAHDLRGPPLGDGEGREHTAGRRAGVNRIERSCRGASCVPR